MGECGSGQIGVAFKAPMHIPYDMLGWVRKKKEDKPVKDTGLLYATTHEQEPATGKPDVAGEARSTHGTDRGPLELRERAMVLGTDDGLITIPYHAIEAWDDKGKRFRVWWNDGGRDYTMSCVPDGAPSVIGSDLRDAVHRNTFE